jgi:hypothetical protein
MSKDGSGCKGFLQGVEGSLGFGYLSERYVLACQSDKGRSQFREPTYESAVKAGEPQECLHILNCFGDGPILHCIHFPWIHFNAVWFDDEAEVGGTLCVKLAFLWFQQYSISL